MKEKVYMNKRTGDLYVYCYKYEKYYFQVSITSYFNQDIFVFDNLEYLGEL